MTCYASLGKAANKQPGKKTDEVLSADMTRIQRIEALEVRSLRRTLAQMVPAPRVNDLLDMCNAFLEKPPAEQEATYPGYPASEWAALRAQLPLYRRARMAGR